MASELSRDTERLAATVLNFSAPGFAVIDGAHFDDLPWALRQAGLSASSLFLGQADAAVQRVGPWLLPFGQRDDALDLVLALVDARPALVCWSCAEGNAVLHRHLRTLNNAQIPAWAAAGGSVPPVDSTGGTYQAVLFRHWDPNVLGGLLPVLDEGQFVRVLGPANEIALVTPDYGGLKRVLPDPSWPAAPTGMLTIRSEQIAGMAERRVVASRQRIAAYLRDVAPRETAAMNDQQMAALVLQSEKTGATLGLSSEQAFGRWAYVMTRTNGRALEQRGLREYITDGRVHPDEKMIWLLKTIAALEPRGPQAQ